MDACLLLVVLCIACALCIADAQQYTVSQKHVFHIHDSGKVDVLMSIVFQLSPGEILSSTYKSILSDTSLKTVEGAVKATDHSGKSLEVNTVDRKGWLIANFVFPEVINGSITPNYTVNLEYRILQSICESHKGYEKLFFPWAHRWRVNVAKSTYVIKFSKVMKNAMDTVCVGATGWRSFCGKKHLKIDQTTAEYSVDGFLHGSFFEWASPLDLAAGHLCEGGAVTTPQPRAKRRNASAREEGDSQSSQSNNSPSTALIIVLTIAVSACCFAASMLFCALRVPVAPKNKNEKLKRKKSKTTNDVKISVQDLSQVSTCSIQVNPQSRSAREVSSGEGQPLASKRSVSSNSSASLASKRSVSSNGSARKQQRNRQCWSFFPRSLPSILPISRRAPGSGLRGAAEVGRRPSKATECSKVVVQDQAPEEDPWAVMDEFIEEDGFADSGAGVWDDAERKTCADVDKAASGAMLSPMGIHASGRMNALSSVTLEHDDSTRSGTSTTNPSVEDNEMQTTFKSQASPCPPKVDKDKHAVHNDHWTPDDEFAKEEPNLRANAVTNSVRPKEFSAGVTSQQKDEWQAMEEFTMDDITTDDAVVQPAQAASNPTLFSSASSQPVALQDKQPGSPQSSSILERGLSL
mmetsp:Transcript_37690/g.70490  ORF Transcript_37690/g.70490 Transcript_37690/m.70490 type:complete len:635 (+) Transcript_37690:57-1961(+)